MNRLFFGLEPFSSMCVARAPWLRSVCNAVQNRRKMPLKVIELFRVSNFLELKDLGRFEQVSKTFQEAVGYQWKSRCQDYFPQTELASVLPATLRFKESLHFMLKNIFDERVYERHIGNVEPASQASQLAKVNFLKKYNEQDPCDPTTTIGREYVLMYIPEYVTINQRGVSLSKADDPNDPQAPRLIRTDLSPGAQSEKTTLKVAVTLNNIIELFKHLKTGNPSTCEYIWKPILEQHGNKRIPAGWVCMRRDVIGRDLPFDKQEALAKEKRVVLPELLPRILFNFLAHARSKGAVYPDGQAPWTFARTSTLTRDSVGINRPLGCGAGGPSGLHVYHSHVGSIGVAVALPAEVQALL